MPEIKTRITDDELQAIRIAAQSEQRSISNFMKVAALDRATGNRRTVEVR